jgi:uncharacterized protein YggE
MTPEVQPDSSKAKLNISLDYRIICAVLAAALLLTLLAWKPWSAKSTSDRTVQVSGETTVKAAPDEFIFYPSYQVENADKQAALTELTKKSEDVVAKLKELGVPGSGIKTNTSGYDYPVYLDDQKQTATYTLQLTVTLSDQKLAQKVQDYLVTTSPTGSVSPQFGFSDSKQKQLEGQARDAATKEARAKADQMGKNLGFKIGKVKSVSDGTGFSGGPIMPLEARGSMAAADDAKATSLAIQPGENELPYTVTVVYYIK